MRTRRARRYDSVVWSVGALTLYCVLAGTPVSAAATLDWHVTAYADGRHNAFTDLAYWKGDYYLAFRHGATHMSMDGEIRVMKSKDLKAWEPCGTVDTFGDDRDAKLVATQDTLFLYFGTWDLRHQPGAALPDRGSVRSYFSTTTDGVTWSKVQGVYEPDFWLWRIREHDGVFYSAAYTAVRPKPSARETRLVRSEDGLNWTTLSVVTTERMAGEADILWRPDGEVWLITRTGDQPGDAEWFRSDSGMKEWTGKPTGVLIHAPVFATWKDRTFISGRAREDGKYLTKVWEIAGDTFVELVTLPSGGDTSYPGMLADPASLDSDTPALFVSWYSQHENAPGAEAQKHAANIYVGRIVVNR